MTENQKNVKGAKHSNAHRTSAGTKSAASSILSVSGKPKVGKSFPVTINQKYKEPYTLQISKTTARVLDCLTTLDSLKSEIELLVKEVYKSKMSQTTRWGELSDEFCELNLSFRDLLCDSIYPEVK